MAQDQQPKPEEPKKEDVTDKSTPQEKQQVKQVVNLVQNTMQRTEKRVITIGELLNDPEELAIERSREERRDSEMRDAEREENRYNGYDNNYSFSRRRGW